MNSVRNQTGGVASKMRCRTFRRMSCAFFEKDRSSNVSSNVIGSLALAKSACSFFVPNGHHCFGFLQSHRGLCTNSRQQGGPTFGGRHM